MKSTLPTDVRDLPVAERLKLVEAIWDSIAESPDQLPLTEAQATEPKRFPLIFKQLRRALVSRFPYGILFIARPDAVVVVGAMHLARNPVRLRLRH